MPSCIRCLLGLLTCSIVCPSALALAQGETSPRELVEQGYFEQGLASVDAGMADGPLRSELVELLEVRALVHLALGNTDALRTALHQLVALAPDYAPPPTASPDFAAEVGRARQVSPGELSARLRAPSTPQGIRHAELINDPGGLGVRAAIRSRAGGPWRQHADTWQPGSSADAQVQAVVLGAQGQLLHEGPVQSVALGDEVHEDLSPAGIRLEEPGVLNPPPPTVESVSTHRRRVVLGVVIGLLAAAGIVAGIVLSQQGDTRYVPVLDW